MIKDRAVDLLLTMPKESLGRCITVSKNGKKCNYKGTLANGLCIKCWDKSVGHKNNSINNTYKN